MFYESAAAQCNTISFISRIDLILLRHISRNVLLISLMEKPKFDQRNVLHFLRKTL